MTSRRHVLVKTFKAGHDVGEGNGASSRFQQEAAIYATIQHPNVVKLIDYGEEDDVRFLVLEFVEGPTLRALLQRTSSSGLPWESAVAIFCGVLTGVEEIHRRNFIHRDLKPENILIGNYGDVKICDFDLAISEQGMGGSSSSETSASGLTGSPGYLAPEIVLGELPTSASDIFSLGIVLYEMLTGARPFEAPSAAGEMNSIVKLPHVSLLLMNPALPARLDELIDRLLAKHPGHRASPAGEVHNWLERHFDIGTAESRRVMVQRYLVDPQTSFPEISLKQTPQESSAKVFPNRRATIAALLSVILAVAGFVAWRSYQNNDIGFEQRDNQHAALPNRQDVAPATALESSNEPEQKSVAVISSTMKHELEPKKNEAAAIEASSEAKTYAVRINSNPWAFLFINGDSIGQTPLSGPIALKAGSHDLLFKNPKLPPVRLTAHIDATVSDTLTYSLWDHVAQLEIQITPWADMFIDGERRELPAGEKMLILLPGKYSFRFVHPQLGEKRETLFLQAGEMRKLMMNMF